MTYTEIKSWCELARITLTLWEVETVKHLSHIYLEHVELYADDSVIPPYMSDAGLQRWQNAQAALFDEALG